MGKTTRWLRGILSGKKETNVAKERSFPSDDKREKKRWSFKLGRDSAEIGNNYASITPTEDGANWLHTFYSESDKEQSKHAIAVAAATAAAADAAVAAAQAAVAVVRLTSNGRGESLTAFQQRHAAIKIQTVFRGFLAKKALRALKALVKLQALVRGYLVRKQTAATLQSMQALIRAQSTMRAQKCRILLSNDGPRNLPEIVPRKSFERVEEARIEHLASVHSRRLSPNLDVYDRSPKIVEIDTFRPKSRSSTSRTSPSLIDSADDMTLNSISPLPCQFPARISIPDCRNFQDYDWCLAGDKCRFSATAQSTPRYGIAPVTPTKSVTAADGVFRKFLNLPSFPNYMSNTESFEAKVRSQSAPKQRPEPIVGTRKRLPLSEVVLESRTSLSGVGMQRSCTRAQEALNFKSAVVDRIDRSVELGREIDHDHDQDFYMQRKW